ncbi:MAG: TIGR04282 family arsenosugar biosynthesis glycosyltransferase [Acidobacteria bacterium]|nr:TIGR04282 family arsenosugar biosynthesis glycosyltransferase [Acidobacteriota bacterium]
MSPSRILVLMGKAPRAGRVKTRLTESLPPDAIVELYTCLLRDSVALGRRLTHTRVGIICPRGDRPALAEVVGSEILIAEQSGTGLGAGLESTFKHFIGAGFSHVMAFNSDSPHLPVAVLERAFTLLADHDVVVGPTRDGGYYLVGARAAHEGLFEGDRLGTSSAFDVLLRQLQSRRLSVATTAEWYDVDEADDLMALAAELRDTPQRAPETAAWLGRHAHLFERKR